MTAEIQHELEENTVETAVEETTETTEVVEEQSSIDVDSLFSGEDLSEEYKLKAKSIFEAVVTERVKEVTAGLQEEFDQKLEEEAEAFSEGLVSKVDEYLEYVVSEWMEENKLAVDHGIRAEMVEDFMLGLKNLFVEHYVEIPEDKVDVVENFATQVDSLKGELDKAVNTNNELAEQLRVLKKEKVVENVSEGLTEVQVEKFKSLSENIVFESEEDFTDKVKMIKQKYFSESNDNSSQATSLTEDSTEELTESLSSSSMNAYVNSLSRIVKS
jgi:hypothetical protein